ncbi:MAG: caspase family protein [Anaerolineales bacterium]|nr:caspase family protein [Anaerolineales bacterium]
MPDLRNRVTIMAVGVGRYADPFLPQLRGPENDIDLLRDLLIDNPATALYEETQFIELFNPTIQQLRDALNHYVSGRSAGGDILLFYYSGHGIPIGRNDFGFATTDTQIYPQASKALPLSLLRFSDLLNTISIANVTPIIIIDACYSGLAGQTLAGATIIIPPIDAVSNLRDSVHSISASNYALLCSCAADELSVDTSGGGIFSHYLANVANNGIAGTRRNPSHQSLGLKDLFPELQNQVLSYSGDFSPRLYLGPTLPDFPLVKNTRHSPTTERFAPYMMNILKTLWNDGDEQQLTPAEIRENCGLGAYGNHSKLSLPAWGLVENTPGTRPKRRRLTERGRKFLSGELKIPRILTKDADTMDYLPTDDVEYISVNNMDN